jgi:hypothetical protein
VAVLSCQMASWGSLPDPREVVPWHGGIYVSGESMCSLHSTKVGRHYAYYVTILLNRTPKFECHLARFVANT